MQNNCTLSKNIFWEWTILSSNKNSELFSTSWNTQKWGLLTDRSGEYEDNQVSVWFFSADFHFLICFLSVQITDINDQKLCRLPHLVKKWSLLNKRGPRTIFLFYEDADRDFFKVFCSKWSTKMAFASIKLLKL